MKKGSHLTEEHRRKMSDARRGIRLSKETKSRMSEAHKGNKHSEATKKKIGKSVSKSLLKYFDLKRRGLA